jgi:hypothetical protein
VTGIGLDQVEKRFRKTDQGGPEQMVVATEERSGVHDEPATSIGCEMRERSLLWGSLYWHLSPSLSRQITSPRQSQQSCCHDTQFDNSQNRVSGQSDGDLEIDGSEMSLSHRDL